MTATKRKNENADYAPHELTKMVIVNDHDEKENSFSLGPQATNPMRSPMERLKKLNAQWERESMSASIPSSTDNKEEPFDAIARALCSIIEDSKTEQELEYSMVKEAEEVQSGLRDEIQRAKNLCIEESNDLSYLSDQLSRFQEQRHNLLKEIDNLEYRQRASQEKIALYQMEASQELDMIMDVEEQMKQQVPRLRATISLYASTTNIKWDYSNPDLLSGQVDIPSQRSFKLFSVHPGDYSPVEMADVLWDLADGKEVQ